MSPLENVPPEIFDGILAELESESDIYHLLLTCKEMHDACIQTLYRVNASHVAHRRSNQPHIQCQSALDWALDNKMETIALRVMEMTPEVCNVDHVAKAIRMKDPVIAIRLLGLPHVQPQLRDLAPIYKVNGFICAAIVHGHIKCLDMLEKLVPINLGKRDYLSNYVEPALALTCKKGYVELVERFAAAGLRQCSRPGVWLKLLPLINAIRYREEGGESTKNYEMAKILLDTYPKLAGDTSLLFAAAQEGHDSVLELLITHGAPKPNREILSFLLSEAIRGGCRTFIQRLLQNGASIVPTTRQRIKCPKFIPPKDRAHKARQNAGEIREILASQEESLSSQDGRGPYVLSEAISADNIPLVRYCISVGAHRIKRYQAILTYRVSSIDMLECLTTKRININLWDEDGNLPIQNTLPLLSHCIDDPLLFFKTFISKVGDIDARNFHGQTVLSYCCALVPSKRSYSDSKDEYRCIMECVEALLNSGAKLDLASATGRSPLHEAAQFSSKEVVSLLLKRGANPNALDNQGRSPLHSAMAHRHPRIVVKTAKRLLKHGADPNHRDRNGTSALHIPASCVHPNYAKRLLHLYISSQGIRVEAEGTDDSDNETGLPSSSSPAPNDREGETQDGKADKTIKCLTGGFLWRRNNEGTTPSVVVAGNSENDPQGCIQFYQTDRGFNVPDAHGITPLAAAFLSCRTNLGRWLVKHQGADLNWLNDRDQTVLDILSEHSATNRGTSLSMSIYVARQLGGLTSRELANCRDMRDLRVLLRGNGPEKDNGEAWGAHLRHGC